jgi:transcriptional antiterminator Rof (Rho-off)
MSQSSDALPPDKISIIRELEQQMRGGSKLEAAAHEAAVRSWQERFRLKTDGPPVELDVGAVAMCLI